VKIKRNRGPPDQFSQALKQKLNLYFHHQTAHKTCLMEAEEPRVAIDTSNLQGCALRESKENSVLPPATEAIGIPLKTESEHKSRQLPPSAEIPRALAYSIFLLQNYTCT
jgi:hypothetical protein